MTNINEEFIAKVKANDADAIVALLEAGANVHYCDDYALRLSVRNGALNIVTKLLEYGANPDANNSFALRRGVNDDRLDIVTKLLEFGAGTNICGGSCNHSLLESSICRNNLNIVIKLLEYNADIHFRNDNPLQISVIHCHYEIMAALLENGADAHYCNKYILERLKINFDKQIADIILPYCVENDYEYFPPDYIRAKLTPIKSANSAHTKS